MAWLSAAFVAAACALALAAGECRAQEALASAPAGPATRRAVFQVSDGEVQKWGLALANLRNARKELGPGTELELVAFGPGIGMLKSDSPLASRVTEALGEGIHVVACQNTMKAMGLAPGNMIEGIGYVPSGVAELIRRQQSGAAYIRP